MSEQNKPFVVTDRRKFTLEEGVRPEPEVPATPESAVPVETAAVEPVEAPEQIAATESAEEALDAAESEMIPGPTPEQAERAKLAYEATAERLDTAIRAANPGADHPPAMNFTGLVQSVYMSAIVQLGGATPEGQTPQVDIIGAKQSVDMLVILEEKTRGNLTPDEEKLLASAIFELRMGFLEITQALARSAAAKMPASPGDSPSGFGKPTIVR